MSPVSKWKGNDNISHIGILERKKNRVKCINIFPLEFSKLCLMIRAKIITLSNVILNIYIENI